MAIQAKSSLELQGKILEYSENGAGVDSMPAPQ
jgi:hypothetical protein